jgi:LuxR family transcriptional regulator, positive regulator of biofilm formation
MHLKRMSKQTDRTLVPNGFINIVGRNMLQNELLLSFLKKETGLKGRCFPDLKLIIGNDSHDPASPQLLIMDCRDINMENFWHAIPKWDCLNLSRCFFALCNADAGSGLEKDAMDNGIRGIFYNNAPLQLISKGICAILKGDLWYSRKALSQYLLESKGYTNASIHPTTSRLTGREKQMLAGIASGYTSKAIADELGISIHTVKVHIYNVYKKINVKNRLQASLWAAKYL